jgi:hypothetical protein
MKAELQELSNKLKNGTCWVIIGNIGSWHVKIDEEPNNFTDDSFRITGEAVLVKENEVTHVDRAIFIVTGLYPWRTQAECQFLAIKNLSRKV